MNKYPDLSNEKIICVDLETYDPELREMGPGTMRRDGNILGCAIAVPGGFKRYYNLGHRGIDQAEKENNYRYLDELLANDVPKLGTNLLYDFDWWVNWHGGKIGGKMYDIQIAEPLLDEYKKSYSLDNLAKEYLGVGKKKTKIDAYCEKHGLQGDPRQYLWMMEYNDVYEYAEGDVELPIKIFEQQWKKMQRQNLLDLFHIEMGQYPLLLMMRKNGVPINTDRVQELILEMKNKITIGKKTLYSRYSNFNLNSSKQIAEVLDEMGIPYGLTEKGNPQLGKEELKSMNHPLCDEIVRIRAMEKLLGTFLVNSLMGHLVGNRIHCSFHPMRGDRYGTKSGRYSSANPNLQQIPSQEDSYGSEVRSCFIPLEDHYWGKIDYSQIEYRLIAHYAEGEKAEEIRTQYRDDPKTDYHQMIMDWTGVDRKTAKRLNFGMAYYMGTEACSRQFGWTMEESFELIERYHNTVPFLKQTRNNVVNVAKKRGHIRTILGRRARINEEMRIARKEYTMFNRLIQGSAADILKAAMYKLYTDGIFNTLVPHLTVHDELDVSIPKTNEGIEAFKEMANIMENCVKLKVPLSAEAEYGDNWAQVYPLDGLELQK